MMALNTSTENQKIGFSKAIVELGIMTLLIHFDITRLRLALTKKIPLVAYS